MHTVPYKSAWANRVEGERDVRHVHDTKDRAVAAGRELAIKMRAEPFIHTRRTDRREELIQQRPRDVPG